MQIPNLLNSMKPQIPKKKEKKSIKSNFFFFFVSNKWMYVERNILPRPSQKAEVALKCEVIS